MQAPTVVAAPSHSFGAARPPPSFTAACNALGTSPTPKSIAGPYEGLLRVLMERGLLNNLPVGPQGVLSVGLPFCAALLECPVLMQFLQQNILGRNGVTDISMVGSDICDGANSQCWKDKERWVQKTFPRMQLQLRYADLTKELMPPSALIIGCHPESSRSDGPWNQIIANVLRSLAPGGICVFGNFYECEVGPLVQMCANAGARAEVIPNPYYQTNPVPAMPHLQFLVLVRG